MRSLLKIAYLGTLYDLIKTIRTTYAVSLFEEFMALSISPILAFADNYIWCIYDTVVKQAIVIDPGSAKAVDIFLEKHQLQLSAILITHHHPDHIGGVATLKKKHSSPVYGYQNANIASIDIPLIEGDEFELLSCKFKVFEVPGHTLDHIAFYAPCEAGSRHQTPWLFCGDTLFSGGCGRLFEGTPCQMHASLTQLSNLPENTEVYCAHEYTLGNLMFAVKLMPNNGDLISYKADCKNLRDNMVPTIPSTIGLELKINPFLRLDDEEIQQYFKTKNLLIKKNPVDTFAAIRQEKDNF